MVLLSVAKRQVLLPVAQKQWKCLPGKLALRWHSTVKPRKLKLDKLSRRSIHNTPSVSHFSQLAENLSLNAKWSCSFSASYALCEPEADKADWRTKWYESLKIRRFLHLVERLISTTQGKRVCQRISPALKIDLASEWALIWSHLRSWCTVLGPCGPTLVAFTLAGTQHQMGGL